VLGRIVAEAIARAAALSIRREELGQAANVAPPPPSLKGALLKAHVAIMAEVKRRSPSRGSINLSLSAGAQALEYASGGASAISVLTEPVHFGGSTEDLRLVAQAVTIPVLCKDFIVDELQIVEARGAGASAILLIVKALSPNQLPRLLKTACEWGLDALVEIRSERELERALSAGASIIGVNNRNLETLEMDSLTGQRLLPLIPSDLAAVAESGIVSAKDVEMAAAFGADAVLVGSSLSRAADPASAARALGSVPRRGRAN